jgi:hypothetical protein
MRATVVALLTLVPWTLHHQLVTITLFVNTSLGAKENVAQCHCHSCFPSSRHIYIGEVSQQKC